jgi:hypothetical protein
MTSKADGRQASNDAARRTDRAATDQPKNKEFRVGTLALQCLVTHRLCIHVRETSKLVGNSCVTGGSGATARSPSVPSDKRGRELVRHPFGRSVRAMRGGKSVVGDLAVFHRDVEVGANEHPLAGVRTVWILYGTALIKLSRRPLAIVRVARG